MKKKLLIAICFMMFSILCMTNHVDAAKTKKAKLEARDYTIGICKKDTSCNASIINKVKNAKYTFKSSNPKIVKIKKIMYDNTPVLESFNYGTAKITLVEKYKGKSRNVGSFKITVKKAKVYSNSCYEFCFGEKTKYVHMSWVDVDDKITPYGTMEYVNEKATYTFYSKNDKIFKIRKNGTYPAFYQMKDTKVIIKETYKKKTRKVGEIKVKPLELESDMIGKTYYAQKDGEYDISEHYSISIAYPVFVFENEDGVKTIIKGRDSNDKDRSVIMKISEVGKYTVSIYATLNDKYDISNNAIEVGKMNLNIVDDLKLYGELYHCGEEYIPNDTVIEGYKPDSEIILRLHLKSELGENFFLENDFCQNVNLNYSNNNLIKSVDKSEYIYSNEVDFCINTYDIEGEIPFSLDVFGKITNYTLAIKNTRYDDSGWDDDYENDDYEDDDYEVYWEEDWDDDYE